MYKKRGTILGVCLLVVVALATACGGSDNDTGNLDANPGVPLSNQVKAYKAITQVPFEMMDQVGGGSPAVVTHALGSKAITDGTCDSGSNPYTCTVTGESGSCTVTVEATEAGDGFSFGLDCDNFTYTDSLGDAYLIDGVYLVTALFEEGAAAETFSITQSYTTPGGLLVSVNGETYTFGGDFQMTTFSNVVGEAISATLTVSGTVNGVFINASYTLNCVSTDTGDIECTET